MRQKLMDFMRGRNGTDQLSMCMMWAACILVFYRYVCKKQYTQHDCICDLCICIFPCVLQKYWQASG